MSDRFYTCRAKRAGHAAVQSEPGGAPANVLAMYAKLGGKTAFCGKVGTDAFGDFLLASLRKGGVGTSALVRDENVPTTLAFVQLDETGNRSFTFYRKPGADIMLRKEEVPSAFIYGCGVFHFGSVSLRMNPAARPHCMLHRPRAKRGALVSYDPNYRPFLWPDIGRAKERAVGSGSTGRCRKRYRKTNSFFSQGKMIWAMAAARCNNTDL